MTIKTEIMQKIILQLEDDLQSAITASQTAHQTATHEESVAENKYDTFGLEASYLAEGLSRQVQSLTLAIQTCRQANFPETKDSPVRLGTFIQLEDENGGETQYFLSPVGGGISVTLENAICKIVTPSSPLGTALLGKEVGDEVALSIHGQHQIFEITATR